MTQLEAALVEITSFLDEASVPYMLIGGLAIAMWGEPRATLDVDLSVWVDPACSHLPADRRRVKRLDDAGAATEGTGDIDWQAGEMTGGPMKVFR